MLAAVGKQTDSVEVGREGPAPCTFDVCRSNKQGGSEEGVLGLGGGWGGDRVGSDRGEGGGREKFHNY